MAKYMMDLGQKEHEASDTYSYRNYYRFFPDLIQTEDNGCQIEDKEVPKAKGF